jgi:bacteriorhodopsin
MQSLTMNEFNLVYAALSFACATFIAATVFFFTQRSQVVPAYKTALTLSGLVCLIAGYHYFRIFNSFNEAYTLKDSIVSVTGSHFNDSYRYVDWLLTVPLLLLELVLVMRLSKEETFSKGWKLAGAAALMVIAGYPGESLAAGTGRWIFWALAMIPFIYIVNDLVNGLGKSIDSQPESVKGLVGSARTLTIVAWSFYPIVFLFPMFGIGGFASIQVGYTVADVTAKAVFGILIYLIAARKSDLAADVDKIGAFAASKES